MSSHGGILSVRSKHFVKLCVVLSNTCIWAGLYISSGNLQRWSSYVCFVALMGVFLKENPPKKWSNCCLLRVRKDWKFLENTQKWLAIWSIGKLKISSPPTFFGAWQMRHFWLTSFESCIRAWYGCFFGEKYVSSIFVLSTTSCILPPLRTWQSLH